MTIIFILRLSPIHESFAHISLPTKRLEVLWSQCFVVGHYFLSRLLVGFVTQFVFGFGFLHARRVLQELCEQKIGFPLLNDCIFVET